MRKAFWFCSTLVLLLPVNLAAIQTHPAQAHPVASLHAPAAAEASNMSVPSETDVAAIQRQLIELLRLSPTLTTVVARDPSLLADQEYVTRNNPQLAQFLASHPEIARNPDFYLFTHMHHRDGEPDEALARTVWPDLYRPEPSNHGFQDMLSNMPPVICIVCLIIALAWTTRLVLQNRRWNRIFKLQSEVHGRIIDKCSTTQELAAYMETEAGRRFLEAAPIPLSAAPEQNVSNAVSRVLTPLQIGMVMVLLGAGFLALRNLGPEYRAPMMVLGVVTLMPGVGFIISAGITWLLANRLGLLHSAPEPGNKLETPYGSTNRL